MNREIKFRGKRLDNGEWVYGGVIIADGYAAIVVYSDYHNWHDFVEVDPATVGQYVGLRDKSGVEVYEGDIITCGDGEVPTEIRWHEESHAYYAFNLKRKEYHRLDKFFLRYIGEIIGNIYDNPELLES